MAYMSNEFTHFHKRTVMYAKDVQRVMGNSKNTARKILKEIMEYFGRRRGNYITVQEFSEFTKIPELTVYRFIDNS